MKNTLHRANVPAEQRSYGLFANNRRVYVTLVVIGAFVMLGILFLARSHAATFSVAIEAETGTKIGNYGAGDVQGASAQTAVRFGASSEQPGQPLPSGATPGISKGIVQDNLGSSFKQDVVDVETLGVTYDRGQMFCGKGQDQVSTADLLVAHKAQFLANWNCDLSVGISSFESLLRSDVTILKAHGVHTWEIGNEMNGGFEDYNDYCNNSRTGDMVCAEKAYQVRLKVAYQTIHAVDPQSVVLYGGLTDWDVTLGPWMEAMLADTAGQPWNYMDGIAYHPYGGTVSSSMDGMDRMKVFMSRNSKLVSKPIWITEYGCWNSGLNSDQQSPCNPRTEAGKTKYLTGMLDALKNWNKGTSFEIRTPICWYILHENDDTPGYGMTQASNPRKYFPVFDAYKSYHF